MRIIARPDTRPTLGREKSASQGLRICVPFFLPKVQTDQRFETQAKARSPKAFGGGYSKNPPFCTLLLTREANSILLARQDRSQQVEQPAQIEAARRELLGEVRIVLGGNRVDKRNLPAEQGKGVKQKGKGQSRSAKLERLLRD